MVRLQSEYCAKVLVTPSQKEHSRGGKGAEKGNHSGQVRRTQ